LTLPCLPQPNRTPTDAFGDNNYFTQETRTATAPKRIDYLRGNHSFYATGGIEQGQINTPRPLGTNSPFYISPTNAHSAVHNGDNNPYGAIGDTII
jgi:hypothetical protein